MACALFVVSARCGGGDALNVNPDAAPTPLSGVVVKGRVSGATVTAYALTSSALSRDRELGATTAGEDGSYALTLAYRGHVLLVATGGSYVDEATGALVQLGSGELTAVVLDYDPTSLRTASINPITHLQTVLAKTYIESRTLSVAEAVALSRAHLDAHFLEVSWATVTPADVASEPRGAQIDEDARAGLILSALSWHAKTISERAGLSGASQVTAMTLVDAHARDLAGDGYFDGFANADPIVVPTGGTVNPSGPSAYRMSGASARGDLALALQRFVASERNVTAIALVDVDAPANKMARNSNPSIFRTGGSDLDVTPPEVTWTVAFAPALGESSGPVGAAKLVRGVVTVTASAADSSGMSALSVNVNGSPLAAAAQGNSPSVYVGTWNTTLDVDGPLTFTAAATDNAATPNSGTSTFTVTVDNTAPAIAVSAPAAGAFYSTSAPILADATDANGIIRNGFRLSGLSGFADSDASDGRVVGAWNIVAAAAVDGASQATFSACDVVGNCASEARSFSVDRTPPGLELLQAPPQFTASSSAYVRVGASDLGAGVDSVSFVVGGTTVLGELESAGVYGASVPLGAGTNQIVIWAADRALSGANSGTTGVAPYRLTVQSLYDTSAPVPTNVTAGGRYRSESSLGIVESSPGVPVTPPQYTNFGSEEGLQFGSTVHKVTTRLRWGAVSPSGSELLTTNASNTPFLVFETFYSPDSDAPFTSATYSISCAACGAGPAATGQLLPAGIGAGEQYLRWALPLNADTVSALGRAATSPVQLDVTVRVVDAAGREGTVSGSVAMHLVSPPVSLAEETNYPTAHDPQSLYGYRLSNDTYDNLFDSTNANFPSGAPARVARYVIRNPFPEPVVVQLQRLDSGAWTLAEDWDDDVFDPNPPTNVPYSQDGHTFPTRIQWLQPEGKWACGDPRPETPCPDLLTGPTSSRPQFPAHLIGSPTQWSCLNVSQSAPPQTTNAVNVSPGGWETRAYLNPVQGGNEVQAAPQHSLDGAPAWRVPAATGNSPGVAVVYIVVPRVRVGAPPLLTGNLPGRSDGKLRYHYADYWAGAGTALETVCYDDNGNGHFAATYERRYWYRRLAAAQFSLSSSLRLRTSGAYDAGGGNILLLGAPRNLVDDSFSTSLDFNTAL